ncbi:MAG: type II secretion system protein [Sedimentisphaerales bacterium]|nr:type II secretion system protein [Sedimentisphaerales bacterium]
MEKHGFTLVEVMIVVTILGILGALAMPVYTDHTTKAKEAAVRSNLSLIRAQIELYRLHHKGSAPGYTGGAATAPADLPWQFIGTTTDTGAVSKSKTAFGPFTLGPYLKKIPQNPFNDLDSIIYVPAATEFAVAADGTSSGWLYKKETGEFRLNSKDTDSKGDFYYTY